MLDNYCTCCCLDSCLGSGATVCAMAFGSGRVEIVVPNSLVRKATAVRAGGHEARRQGRRRGLLVIVAAVVAVAVLATPAYRAWVLTRQSNDLISVFRATQRHGSGIGSYGGVAVRAMSGDREQAMRIGHGFDIHRMAARDDPEVSGPLTVGGVTFDDVDFGIVAHSDGDVVYHSVVDAIFGALTLPDIGQFFPDTDPRWKNAPSHVFMAEAWRQMDERGYGISNIDVTIIAQAPRMMVQDHPGAKPGKPYDHKLAMVRNIAALLKCPESRVNVKARTHENVDAVGEKRAISCHVVVLLESSAPSS
eukprot:TRINITY_DN77739_c0_g1_i1.p1 TRINITY_DN77739_c0_g1~~TRINITY_DN77739_c0_g1_i1.p1  ORF type:complete len:306 (+),score=32.33 TRINITY_DN77739_c0_g1_i1:15-932(+)